jgi:hypothetical protein
VQTQSIKPNSIFIQLPLCLNLPHTGLDPLHDMLRILWPQRWPRQAHIHSQPRHGTVALASLPHLLNFRISIQKPCENGHRRLGIVPCAAIRRFTGWRSLALQDEGELDGPLGAAGDVVDDWIGRYILMTMQITNTICCSACLLTFVLRQIERLDPIEDFGIDAAAGDDG